MTHGTIRLKLGAAAATALALALCLAPDAARAQGPADEFERGEQLLARGDAKGAAELLGRVAESRKTDANAWHQLGLALSLANRQEEAREAFERSIKLRPASAETRAGLAATLLVLGKADAAEREAGRAIVLDAKVALAHYVFGAARARNGGYSRAVEEAEEALRLRPDFYAAGLLLADALLGLYVGESERVNALHRMSPDADDEAARRPVFERREAALAPLKARMRAAAERLEEMARSLPGSALPREARESAEKLRAYASGMHDESASVLRQAQVTRKAIITHKPAPGLTEEARRNNVRGVVRLRAVLTADGWIRHILVIKGLPDGLTGEAIKAARQIKFTPAVKDGRPVSQFVILEYNFN